MTTRWTKLLYHADNAEWIFFRAFAPSVMCIISREGTQLLSLGSAFTNVSAPVGLN